MTDFTTDLAQALVRKEDLKEVFRSHIEGAINTLLATELTSIKSLVKIINSKLKTFTSFYFSLSL